jgi:hypothetical protein
LDTIAQQKNGGENAVQGQNITGMQEKSFLEG